MNPLIDQLASASTPDEVQSILDEAGVKLPDVSSKIEGDTPPPGSPIPGDIGSEPDAEMSEEIEIEIPDGDGKPPGFPPKKKKEPSLRELKDKAAEKALKGMG